jgi:hypothetical protein
MLTGARTTQVSGTRGVLSVVEGISGDDGPGLTLLERVRCLECGAVYAKPAGGGTVRQNPGCPECGYVGWIDVGVPVTEDWQLFRSAEDRPLRPGD